MRLESLQHPLLNQCVHPWFLDFSFPSSSWDWMGEKKKKKIHDPLSRLEILLKLSSLEKTRFRPRFDTFGLRLRQRRN